MRVTKTCRPIYITENELTPGNDERVNGQVMDDQRVVFPRSYRSGSQRPVEAGVKVDGYFALELDG